MIPEDRDRMLVLCRRIYRESDPRKLALWITDLHKLIQRKVEELRDNHRNERSPLELK